MRYTAITLVSRLLVCLAMASASLVLRAQSTDSRYEPEPPRRFAPAEFAESEPQGVLPPGGETLPRAAFDESPYRQPNYEQHQLPAVKTARFVLQNTQVDDTTPLENEAPATLLGSTISEASPASFDSRPRLLSKPGAAKKLPKPNSLEADGSAPSGLPGSVTVFGSLVAVLASFFAIAWFMRRGMPSRMAPLPSEVVEVLGRSTLAARNQMHLIRIGNKLLLVSVTPNGAETLTEITDPGEVDRLSSVCSQTSSNGIAQSFRSVLDQMGREAPAEGESESTAPRRRSPLFGNLTSKGRTDA